MSPFLMKQTPLVSVCMITYNHEAFIAEAIEGVLMQETDFSIELVIGEDCSTDNTWEICKQYQQAHPEKIRLLPSNKNLGINENFFRTYNACRGKYIAICEGDDYWTAPFKLGRQVKFLENSTDFSICAHNTTVHFQNTGRLVSSGLENVNYELKDYVLNNLTGWCSCSLIFKNSRQIRKILESEIFRKCPCGDWLLSFSALMQGKMHIFGDSMGVYRIHDGGVYSSKTWLEKFHIHVSAALAIDSLSHHEFHDVIIDHNVRRLFTEPFDKNGNLTISIDALMGEYRRLETKVWRRNIVSILIKYRQTRAMFFRRLSSLFFASTELD